MIRIALVQDLRRMMFSEYYARTKARKLTQIEAASFGDIGTELSPLWQAL